MTLQEYLRLNGKQVDEFAAEIGAHRATVYRFLSGARRPSWKMMDAIEAATNGKVGPDAWRRAA